MKDHFVLSVAAVCGPVLAGAVTVKVDLADEPTNEFGRIGCREDVVAGREKAVTLSGGSPEADNGPDAPERVAPRDETAALAKSLELKPYSYTVVTLGRDK